MNSTGKMLLFLLNCDMRSRFSYTLSRKHTEKKQLSYMVMKPLQATSSKFPYSMFIASFAIAKFSSNWNDGHLFLTSFLFFLSTSIYLICTMYVNKIDLYPIIKYHQFIIISFQWHNFWSLFRHFLYRIDSLCWNYKNRYLNFFKCIYLLF